MWTPCKNTNYKFTPTTVKVLSMVLLYFVFFHILFLFDCSLFAVCVKKDKNVFVHAHKEEQRCI